MGVQDFRRRTEKRVLELEKMIDAHESLVCPNIKCGKTFQKILLLTDLSKTPRETYYACPHCFSKLEIAVKEEKQPLECPYYFGFLKTLQKKIPIPDECLTCPKLIRCKKRKTN